MKGWELNSDAFNCLNNYFSNIEDPKQLWNEIEGIYKHGLTDHNTETFLRVLQYEYKKGNELAEPITDLAYEIISETAVKNPSVVSELKMFNEDRQLFKDTLRFKMNLKSMDSLKKHE